MKDKIVHFFKTKGYYTVLAAIVLTVGVIGLLSYRASQKELAQTPIAEESKDVEKVEENVTDDRKETESAEKSDSAPAVEKLEYTAPIKGEVIGHYSPDQPVYSYTLKDWRVHNGIDIAAKEGSTVSNTAEGMVERAGVDDLLGNLVVIRHTDGKISRYASLDKISVAEGQVVEKGATIGTVGKSMLLECGEAAHLHYELWSEDKPCDPTFLFESDK